MEESLKISSVCDIKHLTIEIQKSFSSEAVEESYKWLLLKNYYSNFLQEKEWDKVLKASYVAIITTLLDALQPKLFHDKWQENLCEDIFINGIPHEAFLILVKRLNEIKQDEKRDKYALQKILNILKKFVKSPSFETLFVNQCVSHKDWDLKYVSKSNFWNDLITAIVSLPERVANKLSGFISKSFKLFHTTTFIPIVLSKVLKVLSVIHDRLKDSQDCSLEFLSKLTGRLCTLGYADIVTRILVKDFIKASKTDFIWRRISHSFITKMPSNSLDSFIPSMLLKSRWYGYVECILGDEGVKHEHINYIMTVKLYFSCVYKDGICQNAIGYFASSPSRVSHFTKILNSLLDSWINQEALKHQSTLHQKYIASALMVCAGWVKELKLGCDKKEFLNKVLEGTQIRLKSSNEDIRSLGMIVGEHLIKSIDPESPPLKFEHSDLELVKNLLSKMDIPQNPDDVSFSDEDLDYLKEIESESLKEKKGNSEKEENSDGMNEELESDDDIEPFDMSHDVPQSELKRPLYLRDCMLGMVDQENTEWAGKCMRHAEELIKANPYATEEVAEEMAKTLLHLRDTSSVDNFVALRHRILITLTVQCPLVVSNYLISQFCEKEYNIRQRLDILEILASSCALLSHSSVSLSTSETQPIPPRRGIVKKKPNWQIIIDQRLEIKTKRYLRAQTLATKENLFSAIAGNFFYPLLNSYERACKLLKFHGSDSYVLGRFIYTLGIIMCCASNTVHCRQMGINFLQFLSVVKSHEDVFVRQSIIFAVAATYTAIPSSILFSEDMSLHVTDSIEWLKNVTEHDSNSECVEKALYTLSIFHSSASEGSLLYQLRNLAIS